MWSVSVVLPAGLARERQLAVSRRGVRRKRLASQFTDAKEAQMGAGRNGIYISGTVIVLIVIVLVIVFLL